MNAHEIGRIGRHTHTHRGEMVGRGEVEGGRERETEIDVQRDIQQ